MFEWCDVEFVFFCLVMFDLVEVFSMVGVIDGIVCVRVLVM